MTHMSSQKVTEMTHMSSQKVTEKTLYMIKTQILTIKIEFNWDMIYSTLYSKEMAPIFA